MLDRRKLIIANSQQSGGYVQDGLECWVDGILNQGNNTIIDQMGNYSDIGEVADTRNDELLLRSTRCSVKCPTLLSSYEYTIEMLSCWGDNYPTSATTHAYVFGSTFLGSGRFNDGWYYGVFQSFQDSSNTIKDSTITVDYAQQPHLYSITVDKLTNQRKLYVDGRLVGSGGGYTYYTINGYLGINTNVWVSWYPCNLKSLRLYNRPLTAEEIAVNYATDKARFNL